MKKYEKPTMDVVELKGDIVTLSDGKPIDPGEDF